LPDIKDEFPDGLNQRFWSGKYLLESEERVAASGGLANWERRLARRKSHHLGLHIPDPGCHIVAQDHTLDLGNYCAGRPDLELV
jgi:hypothetical protein